MAPRSIPCKTRGFRAGSGGGVEVSAQSPGGGREAEPRGAPSPGGGPWAGSGLRGCPSAARCNPTPRSRSWGAGAQRPSPRGPSATSLRAARPPPTMSPPPPPPLPLLLLASLAAVAAGPGCPLGRGRAGKADHPAPRPRPRATPGPGARPRGAPVTSDLTVCWEGALGSQGRGRLGPQGERSGAAGAAEGQRAQARVRAQPDPRSRCQNFAGERPFRIPVPSSKGQLWAAASAVYTPPSHLGL